MAYDREQVEKLKKYTRDIIDENYFPILHELKKKLSMALIREKELQDRLDRFEKEVEQFKKCHDCHRINVEKREVATQTTKDTLETRTKEAFLTENVLTIAPIQSMEVQGEPPSSSKPSTDNQPEVIMIDSDDE